MGLSQLFRRNHFLDPEDEVWHLESWKWMLRHFGGIVRLKRSSIVRADRDHFPATEATGHDRAEHIFACVKKLAGMSEWPCKLVPQPEASPLRVGELAALKQVSGAPPLGTFGVEQSGDVVITYDPAKIREPAVLVATFAHELGWPSFPKSYRAATTCTNTRPT